MDNENVECLWDCSQRRRRTTRMIVICKYYILTSIDCLCHGKLIKEALPSLFPYSMAGEMKNEGRIDNRSIGLRNRRLLEWWTTKTSEMLLTGEDLVLTKAVDQQQQQQMMMNYRNSCLTCVY